MASEKMNGEATRQEQSSWQQRSQSHRTSGDNVCHNCKEPGHFSRECPNPRQSGGQTCHKCGETGHFARECPNNTGGQSCHKCGELGHFSRECPNKSGPGNDQLCHRCGGAGHFARDCSEQSTNRGSGCHRCGEEGHFARECPNVAADPSRPAPVTYIPEEIDDMDTPFKDAPHFGINFERYDNIPVKVSGLNEPNPVNSFEEANFGSQCMANVKRAGYLKPTPVQKYTFPIVQGGRDLMACAQTGSGKTVAYLLPTITNMIKRGLPSASRSPLVLILAPTRELVKQIYQEARKFSDGTPIRVNEVYGGVSVAYQSQCLEQGCHFLAATPGRLLDFISREKIYLDNIQCLILDEADRMLDMGFEHDVRRIVQQSNMTDKHQRQTLMFSATFPDEVQVLAADFLKTGYLFLAVGRVGGTNLDIEQRILQVNGNDKRDRLFDILNGSGLDRTLVFVELKRVADFLACLLSENNFPTTSISSDRSQREREEALRDFRIGRANVLVATSVAARGLDIPDVKHVVNYDLPQEVDEYVHRIGRTGRIGNSGKATSFFEQGRDEKIARSLVKILSDAFQEVPAWLEQAAEDAVGSGYGPKGGRFSSRDTREGGRGRQNGHQNSGVIRQNDPNSQFGSQAPDFNMQNGPSQASYSYSGDAGGSGTSYNTGRGETGPSYNTGAGTGPSYNTGRGGTGPSYNTGAGTGHSYNSGGSGSEPYSAGGGAGTSYNTSVGGAGQVYNICGGEAGNSDDDWD
nr:vasa [Exaiptasia diaphana]